MFGLRPGASHGVDFVDEDDAGGFLLGLAEEVADAAGADADEHLHEVGAGHGEEGDVGFAGDGFGQQGLTGSGRAHEQGALGDFAAQVGITLRVFEEFDDFLNLGLGFGEAGDVLERHFVGVVLVEHLRLRLADVEDGVAAGAATSRHAFHDEYPQHDQQNDGAEGKENVAPVAARVDVFLLDGFDAFLSAGGVPQLDLVGHLVGRGYFGDEDGVAGTCGRGALVALEVGAGGGVGENAFGFALVAVDDDFVKAVSFGGFGEGCIGNFLSGCLVAEIVEAHYEDDDKGIHPEHAEPEAVFLVVAAGSVLRTLLVRGKGHGVLYVGKNGG